MKINIDFLRTPEQVKQASNQFIVRDYIEAAFNQLYKEGLKGQLERQVSRILRKLDDAVDQNLEEVDFDQTEMDLMSDALEKSTFPVGLTRYSTILKEQFKTSK